jgi:hypothetical protein
MSKLPTEQPVGMTDDAWADIVRYNALQHELEQDEVRKRREDQKNKVKEDLAKQMAEKR